MESKPLSLLITTVILFLTELLYFKIADRFNIIDKPNERSSHIHHTIRGGGIIFLFGILIWFYLSGWQGPWFVLAITTIAVISFLDDVTSLKVWVRFLFQFGSVILIFYQLWPIAWPVYLLVVAGVVCVGTMNAFNFMDGINGITGVYALVMVCTFGYVNYFIAPFTDDILLPVTGLSLLVFLFFNFRKEARCFAGDVGSVTIALILIFFLLQLIIKTNNFLWALLFLLYGTDSIITIIYRLKRKENIFQAHRTHLFQYLSNEMKVPHLIVASGYGVVQAIINAGIIFCFDNRNYGLAVVIALALVSLYGYVRMKVVSKNSKLAV